VSNTSPDSSIQRSTHSTDIVSSDDSRELPSKHQRAEALWQHRTSTPSELAAPSQLIKLPEGRFLVTVCTYNERENIENLVKSIANNLPGADILIIDDNSPDGTGVWAQQASSINNQLLCHIREAKQGLGSALRYGLKYAVDKQYDRVINLDADFSHDPATIPELLAATYSTENRVDVAIGSRYVQGGEITGLSPLRRFLSKAINGYARLLLGLTIGDWSSSFRAYNTAYLAKLPWDRLACDGYGSLQELLWFLHCQGAKIGEVPIHYVNRRLGKSKISWKEAHGALSTLHRLAWSRYRDRPGV
jgi:dolichol-phosphate mannosyltransferase